MKFGRMQKQLPHLTNEMLDNNIEWWIKSNHLEKNHILPQLIEEKQKRMLTYELCDEQQI